MVEADGERAQAPRGGQPIDAIAVLLTEEQIARLRIDRQAAERGLSWPLRERDDEPRRAGCVDRLHAGRIEPVDLRRGVAAPALTQDHEPPGARESQLRGPGDGGRHHFDLGDTRRLRVAGGGLKHEALEQEQADEVTEP